MRISLIFATGFALADIASARCRAEWNEPSKQAQESICQDAPKEIIENLWRMAARGDLLTSKGWAEASSLFKKPSPASQNEVVRVVSDYYAVNRSSVDGTKALITVGFLDAGQIDAHLNYSAPAPLPPMVLHASVAYHLLSEPAFVMMYGSDGKTIVEKKPIPGQIVWRIDDPQPLPWLRVNAAIRYVLEMRDKATDPVVKENANKTLAKLMTLH